MKKEELTKYWIDASEVDFKAMENLFKSKDYVWSLFIGHLVIEKLLKALAIVQGRGSVPKIHDLNKLANSAGLQLDDQQKNLFDVITSFNIETRYPDYKKEFFRKCDSDFTSRYIEEIKEIRLWLLKQLHI